MNHEEAKKRLLSNPKVREAYENPPLKHRLIWKYARIKAWALGRNRKEK